MGSEADTLLAHRYAFINVWRPIRGPLRDAPLAMCDARSVSDSDLIPSDLIYRDHKGEIYLMRHNPRQLWYYLPEMRADEVLLLKCYDSARDGRAVLSPHRAFEDPTALLTCCRVKASNCARSHFTRRDRARSRRGDMDTLTSTVMDCLRNCGWH